MQGFGGERYHLKDVGLDGKIILKWIYKNWDWFDLAQDRDMWWALPNVTVNLWVQ